MSFKINQFHLPFAEGNHRFVDHVKPFWRWSSILTHVCNKYSQFHLAIHLFRSNRRRVSSTAIVPDVVWPSKWIVKSAKETQRRRDDAFVQHQSSSTKFCRVVTVDTAWLIEAVWRHLDLRVYCMTYIVLTPTDRHKSSREPAKLDVVDESG